MAPQLGFLHLMGSYWTAAIVCCGSRFFSGVRTQPTGTTMRVASMRDEGHKFQLNRAPSRSSADMKSHPDIASRVRSLVRLLVGLLRRHWLSGHTACTQKEFDDARDTPRRAQRASQKMFGLSKESSKKKNNDREWGRVSTTQHSPDDLVTSFIHFLSLLSHCHSLFFFPFSFSFSFIVIMLSLSFLFLFLNLDYLHYKVSILTLFLILFHCDSLYLYPFSFVSNCHSLLRSYCTAHCSLLYLYPFSFSNLFHCYYYFWSTCICSLAWT